MGWRVPPEEVLDFLRAPWPRYVTAGDIVLNVAAYLPLGAMLFTALRRALVPVAAFIAAILLGTALSLALESAQMFLPTRIASNLDLLSNSAGAGVGALAAWLLVLPALANQPWVAVRRRALRTDAPGDLGLIVAAMWILTQFHQSPLALSSGDLREVLRFTPIFAHTPQSYLLAEAGVVACTIIAVGLLISLLTRPQQRAAPAIAVTLSLALAAKSLAAVTMARSGSWLQWLTPGVAAGLGVGIVLLALLSWLARGMRAAAAVACILASVAIVNVTPENPYQLVPNFMLNPQPTHLANFSQIVRALSRLWPLAAVTVLLILARAGRTSAVR